jgi:Cu+-exporting ATPase
VREGERERERERERGRVNKKDMAPSNRRRHGKRPATAASPDPNHNPEVITTAFLLGNLHCPTCVSTIKEALQSSCAGHVFWVSPNVVTSVVTVEHDTIASVVQMQLALEEAGFEVSGVTTSSGDAPDLPDPVAEDHYTDGPSSSSMAKDIPTTADTHRPGSGVIRTEDFTPTTAAGIIGSPVSALVRWITPSRAVRRPDSHTRSEAHLHNCEHCRKAANSPQDSPPPGDGPLGNHNSVAKVDTADLVIASDPGVRPAGLPGGSQTTIRAPNSTGVLPKTSKKSLTTIQSDDHFSITLPLFRVTLAIGGMTCAACVNTLTQSLSKKDWIADVAVQLVNNSAVVEIYDKDRTDDLIVAIEDLGYEATLDSVVGIDQQPTRKIEASDTWKATISIGGMTCASCSKAITQELKRKTWIREVAVNLVTNSATVEFEGKVNEQAIVTAIEDIGYDAQIESVVNLVQDEELSNERTVEIAITGLYCQHCPDRIRNSLAGFRRSLEIISEPTLQKPKMKISYTPEAPVFTIRQILAAIEASDPELKASVYHAPSLEERSKQIQRRHQRQILYRVIGTGVLCVPTFILGIVYMSLVPADDSLKKYLMVPWISGISRLQIMLFILSTPVYFFSASLFHVRAIKEIRALWRRGSRVPMVQRFLRFGSMNTLMSLGTTVAYVASVAQLIAAGINKPQMVDDFNFYFDSVVFLTFFLLAGRLIESYSKSKTGDAVEMLVRLRPTTAILVDGYSTEKEEDRVVGADLLDFGDVVRVPHGSSPPADGIVVRGETVFDESSLTGESKPVKKVKGDALFAGTVNKDGPVLVRITGAAGESMLDQIVKVVREGQAKRAPMEQIADLLTTYFVPVVVLVAVLDWLVWMVLGYAGVVPLEYLGATAGGWAAFSLQFAIAVFVVACPCGLALAAPTAIFVGGGLAAKHGILAKGGGEAFETASRIDCIVFDKTGTLTLGGEPTVTDWEAYPGQDQESDEWETLIIGALRAVEENSSHPVAKAIVTFCAEKKVPRVKVDNLVEIPGKGMKASVEGASPQDSFEMIVGNEALMKEFGVELSPATEETLHRWKKEAKSVALAAILPSISNEGSEPLIPSSQDAVPTGAFTLAAAVSIADPIRPEAPAVIKALQKSGMRVWMLSGDNPTTATAVAKQVGIPTDQVIAGVLPAEKAAKIAYLQSTLRAHVGGGLFSCLGRGRRTVREHTSRRATVAMVGDGINDSPALATADVGVAIGSGSDVAISSAAFVLVGNDLGAVPTLLRLSRAVFARVALNFGWALVYNLVAVPVAAGVLYPLVVEGNHVRLNPVWASLAMALSSISVVLSSLALRTTIPWIGFRDMKLKE